MIIARYVFGYVKRGKSDISIYNEYQQVSLMYFSIGFP